MHRRASLRRPGFAALLLAGSGLGLVAPAKAEAPLLPPIMAPASQEHHQGKNVLVMLVTPDLAAAKSFYAGLFGWQFHDVSGTRSPFAAAFLGDRMVAGVVQRDMPAGQQRQPAWLSYFSVRDVTQAVSLAAAQGGKVLRDAHVVPGLGMDAVLADPQGAVFGVIDSASGDPPDVLEPVGAWIWRSLITKDPVSDAVFYGKLLGFESAELPAPPGEHHLLLSTETYARAMANSLPGDRPNLHPHWLNFVRVDDAGQSAAKATALGGRILVPPRPDRHGGMLAVVADPQGAPVGLLEWATGETKELAK